MRERLSCSVCTREIRRQEVLNGAGESGGIRYTAIEYQRGREVAARVVVECPVCKTPLNDNTVVRPS